MKEAQDRSFDTPRQISFEAETGFLVLRLERNFAGLPDSEVMFKDKVFQPKPELHITVVSREAAERVKAHLEDRPQVRAELDKLIRETDWSYRRQDRYFHIREEPEVETLIQMAEVPGVEPFFKELSRLVGEELSPPPTHITLYTRGTEKGIGLPNQAVFKQLAVGPFEPEELKRKENSRTAGDG